MKTQDPKFYIHNDRLHGQSGIVPEDEPLFILRARDYNALPTLHAYLEECQEIGVTAEHIEAIKRMIEAFQAFYEENPDRMKHPDTSIADLHDGKP